MGDELAVKCENKECGALIGRLVIIEGVEMLKINGLIIRVVNAVCTDCGTPFHFTTSDRILERLIRRKVAREGRSD